MTTKNYRIPADLQEQIQERGFAIYHWIDDVDIKNAIKIAFLKSLYVFGPVGLIVFGISFLVASWLGLAVAFGINVLIMMLYLVVVSIQITLHAASISHIVLTHSHVAIGKEILQLSDQNSVHFSGPIMHASQYFLEDPFGQSGLQKEHINRLAEAKKMFEKGLDSIAYLPVVEKNNNVIIVAYIAYFLFAISVVIMYFVGIFAAFFVGIFLNFAIKKYLLFRGHTVVLISEYFHSIEKSSEFLLKQKEFLMQKLENAFRAEWKEGLLLQIQSGFSQVSIHTSDAIDTSQKLQDTLKKSQYGEIFDKNRLDCWLKKQILDPLDGIIVVLQNALQTVQDQQKQIHTSSHAALELAYSRLQLQENTLQQQLNKMRELRMKVSHQKTTN